MLYTDIAYHSNHDWEYIFGLWEDFNQGDKPSCTTRSLKRRAAHYLGTGHSQKLSRAEFRQLMAKANKMKTSDKKEERQRGIQLARQVQWAFNLNK